MESALFVVATMLIVCAFCANAALTINNDDSGKNRDKPLDLDPMPLRPL
jgi:hypothetical protein